MSADLKPILPHTDVRWLSQDKVLSCVYQLKNEIMVFFMSENESKYSDLFTDDDWCIKMAYLTEISEHINKVNVNG